MIKWVLNEYKIHKLNAENIYDLFELKAIEEEKEHAHDHSKAHGHGEIGEHVHGEGAHEDYKDEEVKAV